MSFVSKGLQIFASLGGIGTIPLAWARPWLKKEYVLMPPPQIQ